MKAETVLKARGLQILCLVGLFTFAGVECHAEELRSCRVDFRFELEGKSAGAPQGALRFRPYDDETWRVAAIEGGAVQAHLEANRSWLIEVDAAGFWGPTQVLNVADDCSHRTHRMPLWPVGQLSGKLSVDDRQSDLPKELNARLRSVVRPGVEAARAIGRVGCDVDRKKSTWSCTLPAGPLDVVFSAADLTPIYRRNLIVEPGKTRRAEVLQFRTGASVAGYVEVEDGDISPECRAQVKPMDLGPSPQRGRPRFKTESVAVNERGFFQLSGLATGTYVLEIEQPGFAAQKVFPLDLFEGRETFLKEPVVLRRPLDIAIQISPPRDWLETPWHVTLMRASAQSAQFEDAPIFDGPADATGRAMIPQQPPGRYSLAVSDSVGNPFHAELILQIVDASDATVDVDIDLVVVEGQVSLGDRPVSGELFFGGVYGARSVRLPVDAEGAFQGVLPSEGIWEVDIRGQNPELNTTVEAEVELGPSGRALFDIELPDTQVFGQIIDEKGGIAKGARVSLSTELGNISTETDARGEFELLAVPAEIAWISAKLSTPTGRRSSRSVGLAIVEGQPIGPVVLRLLENRTISGVVLGPRGPVAGAQVRLRPTGSSIPITTKVRTDLAGAFVAEIPEQARRVEAAISAPGHTLKLLEFDVPDDLAADPVRLQVPAQGGTLDILAARSEGWRLDVIQDGRLISFQTLYEWTMAHGGGFSVDEDEATRMVIPQLAAGDYRVCMRPKRAESYGEPTDPPANIVERLREQGQCFDGYLGVAAQLSYRFDAAK